MKKSLFLFFICIGCITFFLFACSSPNTDNSSAANSPIVVTNAPATVRDAPIPTATMLWPNGVNVDLESSKKFSQSEIEAAAQAVLGEFKDFEAFGCTLLKLEYDESKSNRDVNGYIAYGKGSITEIEEKNVIILFSVFTTSKEGANHGFEPNSAYGDWKWVLIRDNITDSWRVDDWGY